jgi:hypothetical protein
MAKKVPAKKKSGKAYSWSMVILGAVLFLALGVGLITAYRAGATRQKHELAVASGVRLESARAAITKQYLAASSTDCTDPSDPVAPGARVAVFYKYLRVNLHADRAVIRGCDDHDSLLAYIDGSWQTTQVNMSLDTSANPVWQRACDIMDITRADTKVRPENSTIDADNLKLCNALANNKILQFQDL